MPHVAPQPNHAMVGRSKEVDHGRVVGVVVDQPDVVMTGTLEPVDQASQRGHAVAHRDEHGNIDRGACGCRIHGRRRRRRSAMAKRQEPAQRCGHPPARGRAHGFDLGGQVLGLRAPGVPFPFGRGDVGRRRFEPLHHLEHAQPEPFVVDVEPVDELDQLAQLVEVGSIVGHDSVPVAGSTCTFA